MFLQTIYIENASIVFDENNFFCCENKSNLLSINNVGTIDGWTMPYETFEEKYEKMKMDKFKKDYPTFSNIQHILNFGKQDIKYIIANI